MPSQPVAAPSAFVFGKLPSHGDFVSRGLSSPAREAWDAWVGEGLAGARERLGADFEAAHDAAPPWRFVIGPGRFGLDWRAGALAPSVDSVGRRYVVVVGCEGLAAEAALASGEGLAEQAEGLIYDAFEGGWSADRLSEAAVAALRSFDWTLRGRARDGWWTAAWESDPLASDAADLPRMLEAGLADRVSP